MSTRVARLPRWAQTHIAALTAEVDTHHRADHALNAACDKAVGLIRAGRRGDAVTVLECGGLLADVLMGARR